MSFGFGFGLPSWQPLSGGFNPSSLFVGGVQGTWYDPSDASTLFSDTAGTTPSPTPGAGALSVVGLMLDKSQGLALGSELIVNGDFSNGTTGWSATNSTLSASNNQLTVTSTANFGVGASTGFTTVIGRTYRATAQLISCSAATARIRKTDSATDFNSSTVHLVNGPATPGQTFTVYFQATATTTYIMAVTDLNPSNITIDNVSVKEIAGNHAISYNTTTARPELSARVNLLTYSEQFNVGSVWSTFNAAITPNTTIAPDGTLTADTLSQTTVDGGLIGTNALSAGTYNLSIRAKANSTSSINLSAQISGNGRTATFTLTGDGIAGAVFQQGTGGTVSGGTSSILALGNGWYECRISNISMSGTNSFVLATGGINSVFIWGADARPANIGTSVPAYQRIADQYTYDSSGFPRYLAFNGTASGMYTPANLNLSGTDKATVFAGVRKLNQTVNQRIVELSNSTSTNSGSFQMWPGDWSNGTGPNYSFSSRGTAVIAQNQAAESPANYAAPISNVLGASGDIAGDSTILRINGSQVATGTGDQGAGNFGSYPLFVGNRNNSSLWFNGYIYSLIVVGAASTAAQISSTESWINGKEGGVY